MECGQERRKHFSLGPRAKHQQQAAFTDAMGRDARVDKCCSDRYLSVQIRVQNSPLALGEENFGFCCWRTWSLIWKNKILLQFNGIPCNKHVYFVEVLGEYPLITPSIISLISSSNSRCNWVILLFFRPDFYIQWPLVVSKKSCHKKVSLKYAPWSCIGKGRPISTAAAFENSFMSNSKLISWYFNTFKKLFQGNSLVMFSYMY